MPSFKEKKRYLAFEIVSEGEIDDFPAVSRQIKENSLNFLGEMEMAKAGMMIINDVWQRERQRGILRVNNRYVNHAKASLAFVTSIAGKDVLVRSLGVSGTLKKAKEKYMAM